MVFLHPREDCNFNIFRKVNVSFKWKRNIKISLHTGNVESRISHLGLFVNDLCFHWGLECLSLMLSFENSYSCLMAYMFLQCKSVYKVTRICSQSIYCQKARYILYCIGPCSVIKNGISLFFHSFMTSIKQFIADLVYALQECSIVDPCACFVFSANSGSNFESHLILVESIFSLLYLFESALKKLDQCWFHCLKRHSVYFRLVQILFLHHT